MEIRDSIIKSLKMIPGEVLYKSESFSLPPVRTRREAHRMEMIPWAESQHSLGEEP